MNKRAVGWLLGRVVLLLAVFQLVPAFVAAWYRELAVLEEFMPEPLSEEELEEIVDDAIAEVGATSMRDFGRVMADVMPQVSGRADGSVVSQLVREKLA